MKWLMLLFLSLTMTACVTTEAQKAKVIPQPEQIAQAEPADQAQPAPVEAVSKRYPVPGKVGTMQQVIVLKGGHTGPVLDVSEAKAGSVVAPVIIPIPPQPEERPLWHYMAAAGGVLAATGVVLFAADQAGAFDTRTVVVQGQPTR